MNPVNSHAPVAEVVFYIVAEHTTALGFVVDVTDELPDDVGSLEFDSLAVAEVRAAELRTEFFELAFSVHSFERSRSPRGAWSGGDVRAAEQTLRRSLTLVAACDALGAELGRDVDPSALRDAFRFAGLESPASYLGEALDVPVTRRPPLETLTEDARKREARRIAAAAATAA